MNGKNFTGENRHFVIGDIHGAYIPLQQCLERCGFDYEKDTLIVLGDICDGWPYVYECVEILLKIKNIFFIVGNHDMWFIQWLQDNRHPDKWSQGGRGTAISYMRNAGKDTDNVLIEYSRSAWDYGRPSYRFNFNPSDVPAAHVEFFESYHLYYKDIQNRLFIHAGFDRGYTLRDNQRIHTTRFYWDRLLWEHALSVHSGESLNFNEEFSEIFIGHTATTNWFEEETDSKDGLIIKPGKHPITTPMHADIIWNLDTGAGSNGKLTIMDIDSKEFWQSDNVNEIYGDYKPRG